MAGYRRDVTAYDDIKWDERAIATVTRMQNGRLEVQTDASIDQVPAMSDESFVFDWNQVGKIKRK
jgi:hypothetical protein